MNFVVRLLKDECTRRQCHWCRRYDITTKLEKFECLIKNK